MVNQTLISFKCNTGQLAQFDDLCLKLGCNRNKLLNILVSYANVCLSSPEKLNMMRVYSMVSFDDD